MTPYERADIVVRHIDQEGLAVFLDADAARVRALVAAAIRAAVEEEREACAQVAEILDEVHPVFQSRGIPLSLRGQIAAGIRARGES